MEPCEHRIAVVSREFAQRVIPPGISTRPEVDIDRIYRKVIDSYEVIPRLQAEENPSVRQLVAYGVVRIGKCFLVLRRLPNGHRSELRRRLAIALGGHVCAADIEASPQDFLRFTLLRELAEEIGINGVASSEFIAIVNDRESKVGAQHIGIIFEAPVTGRDQLRGETGQAAEFRFGPEGKIGRLMSGEEVAGSIEDFDPWSRLIISGYYGLASAEQNPRQSVRQLVLPT